jgi:hypothetical protein
VVGIEPSASGIENARLLLPDDKFYCMGVYDNPEQMEERDFDAVVSTEVIENIYFIRVNFCGLQKPNLNRTDIYCSLHHITDI